MAELVPIDLGRASYQAALDVQRRLLSQVQASPDDLAFLVLVEHDPAVITLGRRGTMADVLASRRQLAARGIEVQASQRGGLVTYHGPGQLVAYPIVRLGARRRTIHAYLRSLEDVVIGVLAGFDVQGVRRDGYTGVWVGDEKIAAIGIAVSRWVAYHGVALNVSTDLTAFDLIVPCGITDRAVTSLTSLLGRQVSIDDVKRRMIHCTARVLGFESPPLPDIVVCDEFSRGHAGAGPDIRG